MPATAVRIRIGMIRPSAVASTLMRIRRMSRMIPQYSSAGIWPVFQRR